MLRLWDRAAKCFENQKSTEYLKKPDLRVSTHTLIHTHKHNIILLRPVSVIQLRNNNTVYTLLETPHYIHERSANVSHANLHDNPTTFNQEMVNTFYTSLGKVIMSVFRKSMWYVWRIFKKNKFREFYGKKFIGEKRCEFNYFSPSS